MSFFLPETITMAKKRRAEDEYQRASRRVPASACAAVSTNHRICNSQCVERLDPEPPGVDVHQEIIVNSKQNGETPVRSGST
jgi:hypothetical protein